MSLRGSEDKCDLEKVKNPRSQERSVVALESCLVALGDIASGFVVL